MRLLPTLVPALFLIAPHVVLAQLPSVPGYEVTVYATVTDPIHISFDHATDMLYAGRDNSGSGGGNDDAVKIHKIASGGSPVTEYGNATIADPDAVFFDAVGTASEGAPGSVIVGGIPTGGGGGRLVAVRPDETIQTIDGPSPDYSNPTEFAVDSTGRVLMADLGSTGTGKVLVVTGSGTPTPLITIP